MKPPKALPYSVYYSFIPFPSSGQYNPNKDGERIEAIVPHQLYAYTAEDAVVQAILIFEHGRPYGFDTLYDDLGREFKVIRVEPGSRHQ